MLKRDSFVMLSEIIVGHWEWTFTFEPYTFPLIAYIRCSLGLLRSKAMLTINLLAMDTIAHSQSHLLFSSNIFLKMGGLSKMM